MKFLIWSHNYTSLGLAFGYEIHNMFTQSYISRFSVWIYYIFKGLQLVIESYYYFILQKKGSYGNFFQAVHREFNFLFSFFFSR